MDKEEFVIEVKKAKFSRRNFVTNTGTTMEEYLRLKELYFPNTKFPTKNEFTRLLSERNKYPEWMFSI